MKTLAVVTSMICSYGIGIGNIPLFFGVGLIAILWLITLGLEALTSGKERKDEATKKAYQRAKENYGR